jgi:hypothetical protein
LTGGGDFGFRVSGTRAEDGEIFFEPSTLALGAFHFFTVLNKGFEFVLAFVADVFEQGHGIFL